MKKNNTTKAIGPDEITQDQKPPSLLQKAEFGLDQNTAEQKLMYTRHLLGESMHAKKGVLTSKDITNLLDKTIRYFGFNKTGPYAKNIEDAFQMVYINKSDIVSKQWGRGKVLEFDALALAGLRVKTWSSFDELERQAKAAKNTKAAFLIEQTKQVLEMLFTYQGVSYEPNTIKSIGLVLPCESVDEDALSLGGAHAVNVKHDDNFIGYTASYKSPGGYGKCILAVCRDSTKTRTNVKVAALRDRIAELESRMTQTEEKLRPLLEKPNLM